MKSVKLDFKRQYVAPCFATELCPKDSLCENSYLSSTEDFEDGGDLVW